MDIYKQAVWNELKNTVEYYTRLVEMSQSYETGHLVSRSELDKLRHKINGLISQLDQYEMKVA